MRAVQAFQTGRRFLAPLTPGRDLLGELADFCRAAKLHAALLTVTGSVRSGTIGTFDPDQEVYVTHRVERPLEIAACHGTVTPGDDRPCLRAGIVLADATGQILAGRLLSPTVVLMAEATLDEMIGADSRIPGGACRRLRLQGRPAKFRHAGIRHSGERLIRTRPRRTRSGRRGRSPALALSPAESARIRRAKR